MGGSLKAISRASPADTDLKDTLIVDPSGGISLLKKGYAAVDQQPRFDLDSEKQWDHRNAVR